MGKRQKLLRSARDSASEKMSPNETSNKLKDLRKRHTSHHYQSPLSPPARLRRLGVRQAEDQLAFTAHAPNETLELIKQLSSSKDHGSISPSDRQLKRLFPLGSSSKNNSSKVQLEENTDTYIRPGILKCSRCAKTFLSYHGYDIHLESHEGTALKCWLCNIRFTSNKSLLQHQRFRHKKERKELIGGVGFHNIIFIDFSCEKFPDICKQYCEKHGLQTASDIHNHSCLTCKKSFPMSRALKLHNSQHHYTPSKYICNQCNHDYLAKSNLEQHKQKYSFLPKKHLSDLKRTYIRSLALMPKCMMDSLERKIDPPEVNLGYHKKLKEVESVTRKFYDSQKIASDDENSDSSA